MSSGAGDFDFKVWTSTSSATTSVKGTEFDVKGTEFDYTLRVGDTTVLPGLANWSHPAPGRATDWMDDRLYEALLDLASRSLR
jgi:hypothetical protein